MSKSPWINHIKNYAAQHGLSYACALSNPDCSASYKKSKTNNQSTSTNNEGLISSIEEKAKQRRLQAMSKNSKHEQELNHRNLRSLANGYVVNIEQVSASNFKRIKDNFNSESDEFKEFFINNYVDEYKKLMAKSKRK